MTIPVPLHAAALGLVALDVILRAARLRLLVKRDHPLAVVRAVVVNAYGDAASALTPARLGGEPVRFLGLKGAGVGTPAALVALGLERVIDWILAGLAAVGLAALFGGTAVASLGEALRTLASARALPWVAGVAVLLLAGLAAVRLYRRRNPRGFGLPLREATARLRHMAGPTLAAVAGLTALSMAARVAILPILAVPLLSAVRLESVIVGSFGLQYGQLVLPTPAGAGAVELGFVAGFAGVAGATEIAGLLVAWRLYTVVLGVGFAVALYLARRGLDRMQTAAPERFAGPRAAAP